MSLRDMDIKPELLYLEKKTEQTLHERFSKVLMEQLTQRKVLFKGRQRSMVLRLKNTPGFKAWSRFRSQGATSNASVWTRIGWNCRWKQDVWSFRNKYRRRITFSHRARFRPKPTTRFSSGRSSCFLLRPRSLFNFTPKSPGLKGVLRRRKLWKQVPQPIKAAKLVRSRQGVASAQRGRVLKKAVPTKKQLDFELDQYMSKSRSRLDQQLDDYMSCSRSRLDKDLDEYMAMAGEGNPNLWD